MEKLFTNGLLKQKLKMLLLVFLMIGGFASTKVFANSLVLSSTTYENKVVVQHCDSYNSCFWIAGGWSRIDWYANGVLVTSHYMYGMGVGNQTISVDNYEIDCSHVNPGSNVTITAKTYHHDAYSFGYWSEDMVATQTLKSYTNVSNVQATDGLYMTKIRVSWDIHQMFNSHSYRVQKDNQTISGLLPGGSTSYMHTGLQPGTTGNYRVYSYINNVTQISSTNQGSTFNPNMQASDDLENSISITWNNTGATYQASGFYLDWYNDETGTWEFLWERDDNIYNSKTDNGSEHELIPGFTYQYRLRVKPVGVSDVIATTSGKISPNGKISGYVRTPLPNQVPVSGVMVKAVLAGTALPTDTTTTYVTYTNASGYYEIDNIYYYNEADFVVTPIYDDRNFSPGNEIVTLNISSNTATVNFNDLSSFAVSGTILSQSCPVSGVEIMVDNDSTGIITDINGNYIVTVSSGGTYTIKPLFGEHLFDPDEREVVVSDDVAGIDFSDTTVYLVEGYLSASCNTFIGTGDIRFFSTDDSFCFDQTVTTDETGYYSVYLPAATYRVNVPSFTSFDNDIINNIDVMAYFSLPEIFDITNYDEDTFHGDTTELNLTYRLKPTLTMGGLSYVGTCSGEEIPLVRQFEPSLIQFTANEEFNGNICPASDGYIVIRENVSSFGMGENTDTLYYEMGETIEYGLIPGTPNLIEDLGYTKFFEAILFRDNQTDTIYTEVIVLGQQPREQNFTTVTPQIPFHILHNPPGDASYSFLEEGESISSSFTQSFLQEGSVDTYIRTQTGINMSVELSVGIGASIDVEQQNDFTASFGVGSGGLTEWASLFTTTVTEEYQTSGNLNITGDKGDVYIGSAINMIYGITDVLEYDFDSCKFDQSQTIFMQPQGLGTTFMYTESHILDVVIPELQSISDYYNSISEPDSAAFYANELSVWQQVVAQNHENIENAPVIDSKTFSGGVGHSYSVETSSSHSTSFDFNIYIDYGVAVDAGLAIGGVGAFGGVAVSGRSTWGSVVTTDTTYTTNVGYYLGDDDLNDDYTLQIMEDQVYGVPAFKLISGQTSCPWEEGTVPREGVQLSSESSSQSVEEHDAAVFILHLANTSQTDEEMTYNLMFDHGTNPGGAVLTIGGSPVVGDVAYPYTIPAWTSVDVTVTVGRGPTDYDYNGLKFYLASQCEDENIYDDEYLNVHFYKEFNLELAVDGQGTTNIATGTHQYMEETVVNLYASANSGNVFEKWIIGSDEFYTPAIAVLMDADKTATAYFTETTEPQYTVDISLTGYGTTTPPAGSYTYNEGTVLGLIANPDLYNAFLKWTVNGEEITEAITEITITQNTEIVAEFVETRQLNLSVSGNGTTNPASGYYTYNYGTVVGLYASPDLGNVFEKWVIDGEDIFTQYTEITVDDNITATACFVPTTEEQHFLTISTGSEGGYTIPPAGEHIFSDGSLISLTAFPDNGYVFDKWIINSIESTNNPVNLTFTGDFTAVAYFVNDPVNIEGETISNVCSIFPNPSDGIAKITSQEPITEVRVMDITGKLTDVFYGSGTDSQTISLENYEPGIYLVNIATNSGASTLKMQIIR